MIASTELHVLCLVTLFTLLLWLCFIAQQTFNWEFLSVTPHSMAGLLGLLTAPLLHGSVEHILANTTGILLLST